MKVEDFKESSGGFFDHKELIELWGDRVDLAIYVDDKLLAEEADRRYDLLKEEFDKTHDPEEIPIDEYEELFGKLLDENPCDGLSERTVELTQAMLEFLAHSRTAVTDELISWQVHKTAEEWLCEDDECEDEDVTVTPEQFADDVFLISLTVEFKNSLDVCGAFLELGTKPDYFAGHRIHVKVTEDKAFVYEGI